MGLLDGATLSDLETKDSQFLGKNKTLFMPNEILCFGTNIYIRHTFVHPFINWRADTSIMVDAFN